MKYVWQKKNWFDFKFDKAVLLHPLSQLRRLQGGLLGRVSALDLKLETAAQAEVLVEEAFRTAEIEGEKLDRDAVRSSVAVRLGLPEGAGKPDRRIDGLVDVLLDAVRNHDTPLTLDRLNGWHAALFPTGHSGLRKIRAGQLKGLEPMQVVSGPAGREKVHYEAVPGEDLKKEMKLFFDWWSFSSGKMDGVLRAAAAHLRFVTIHPYEDGNGRLGRALTDMALAQDEGAKIRFYSVSSQIMKTRKDYYRILENVQRYDADTTEWFLWFVECVTRSIERSKELISGVFARAEFSKRHARTILNERQRKTVDRLLDAGPGGFVGGLTTRKYVALTGASRATAFRETSDMVEKGVLRPLAGRGRSAAYEIAWD